MKKVESYRLARHEGEMRRTVGTTETVGTVDRGKKLNVEHVRRSEDQDINRKETRGTGNQVAERRQLSTLNRLLLKVQQFA